MRRVDENIDFLVDEIVGEASSATKSANPHRNGLRRRRGGAAREREHHSEVRTRGQPLGELTRFRDTAENEDSHVSR